MKKFKDNGWSAHSIQKYYSMLVFLIFNPATRRGGFPLAPFLKLKDTVFS